MPIDTLVLAGVSLSIFGLSMTILAIFPALTQTVGQSNGVMTLIAVRRLRIFSVLVGAAAALSNLCCDAALVVVLGNNARSPIAWIGCLGGVLSLLLVGLTIPLLVRYSAPDSNDLG